SWLLWNKGLQTFSLPHGFSFGSSGWIVGESGRRTRIKFVHIDYARSFVTEIKYPLCTVLIECRFRIWQGKTDVTIEARFKGVFASICRKFYAQKIKKFMWSTIDGLKHAAERGLSHGKATPSASCR
ncbi:MAG: hypothetical protein ACREXO_21255, partial [Advenella sp.]